LIQAAASIAGADRLLCVGGAQAISALAQGIAGLPECEIIVGPGNKYVTAAKFLASARTRIDMLAGPSELLIVASQEADPRLIAADLLAQAEHDVEAIPLLLSDSPALLDAVDASLDLQLAELPTAPTATKALANGGKILIRDLDQAIEVSNRLAPEHLQLMGSAIEGRARDFRSFGALFMGPQSGEVLGDYAAGPNHVLPTGTSARSRGGLSVLDFLALRTWMRLDSGEASREVARDARDLAELEGLHGHAVAAGLRT
jgi:phosphoribosyl-ATP pyrophosphohydrolase/phosphoribosyl-AMP cyclohydrolase/histidinol dehydrogenase